MHVRVVLLYFLLFDSLNVYCNKLHTYILHGVYQGNLIHTSRIAFMSLQAGISLRVSVYIGSKSDCRPGRPVSIFNDTVALFNLVHIPQPSNVGHNFTAGNLILNHSE